MYFRKNAGGEKYAGLPLIIIVTVAVTGMTEWVFHVSNPSGFLLMMIMAPLIFSPARTAKAE
jgi:hypothetical protein